MNQPFETVELPLDATLPVALLVEDEPLVAMVAEESLRCIGYEPVVAASGASAIDVVQRGLAPVFALIDIGLPDMRGDDLVPRLRSLQPILPVLIVSGYAESDLRARFAGDPSVAVVTKPYTEADLVRAARTLGVPCEDV